MNKEIICALSLLLPNIALFLIWFFNQSDMWSPFALIGLCITAPLCLITWYYRRDEYKSKPVKQVKK